MKKNIFIPLIVSAAALLFTGCGSSSSGATTAAASQESTQAVTQEETSAPETSTAEPAKPDAGQKPVSLNIMALKGPTAMGMVKFMDEVDSGAISDNEYHFTIAAAIDEVTPAIIQGNADIAAVPANLASVLYNNTKGQVQVLAVNTLGVLYLVENGETIQSAKDLRGKTIYASGKGATPEYALNYILSENGIDPENDVTIEWKSEHAECLAALTSSENAIAMLPQPFATTAQAKVDTIRTALDLTEEWDKLQAEEEAPSALITGVIVGRKSFIEENPEAVSAFLDHYGKSVDYVNDDISGSAALIEKYDIVTASVAEKALPFCNITFIEGSQLKEKLSGYLSVLHDQNPAAVGSALPDDDFYYSR